jgi:hypothetical protein
MDGELTEVSSCRKRAQGLEKRAHRHEGLSYWFCMSVMIRSWSKSTRCSRSCWWMRLEASPAGSKERYVFQNSSLWRPAVLCIKIAVKLQPSSRPRTCCSFCLFRKKEIHLLWKISTWRESPPQLWFFWYMKRTQLGERCSAKLRTRFFI